MEAEDKVILSVRIKESVRDRFEETCQLSGLRKAEVVEALLEWFMNPKETI